MVNLLIYFGYCVCQLKLHDLSLFGSLFQISAKIRINSIIKFLLIYFVAAFMMLWLIVGCIYSNVCPLLTWSLLQRTRHLPGFPQAFTHCSCVSKRFWFPPQPPYQKRVQLLLGASKCHFRTNLAHVPSPLGSWQMSTAVEAAVPGKVRKRKKYENT